MKKIKTALISVSDKKNLKPLLNSLKKNNIKIGDLVFFRTGKKTMHAGIMINDQQFMHASTSSGVMISALQERYWSDAYLTTRRVL